MFVALQVATTDTYAGAFGDGETDALALLLLEIEHYGIRAAQVFFALWLTPLGYLAYRSGLFPKPLGIILVAATISYLADVAVAFLFLELTGQTHDFFSIIPAIAEIWMLFFLLSVGVRSPRNALHPQPPRCGSQREIRLLLEPRPRGPTSRSPHLRRSGLSDRASAGVTPIEMPHDEPALRGARRTRRLRPGVWRGRGGRPVRRAPPRARGRVLAMAPKHRHSTTLVSVQYDGPPGMAYPGRCAGATDRGLAHAGSVSPGLRAHPVKELRCGSSRRSRWHGASASPPTSSPADRHVAGFIAP